MPQKSSADLDDIAGVISSVLSRTIVENASVYQQNNTSIQIISNSTNCVNTITYNQVLYYSSASKSFSSSSSMQTVYANIAQALTSTSSISNSAFLSGNEQDYVKAAIVSICASKLTSEVLSSVDNSIYDSNVNIQGCFGSVNGENCIIATQENMVDIYTTEYLSNSTVQNVSADIQNALTNTQTEKKTSPLIIIAILLIVVLVVIAVIVVIVMSI